MKSAAMALTRMLRAELKPRGVQVSVVVPVQTNTPAYAPLHEPKLHPQEVAAGTLDALEAGQDEVFPGALSRGAAGSVQAGGGRSAGPYVDRRSRSNAFAISIDRFIAYHEDNLDD